MAKAELTWGKPNAYVAAPSGGNHPNATGLSLRPPVNQALPISPISGEITLDSAATDYAIIFLCGDVDWGFCGKQFHQRWKELY